MEEHAYEPWDEGVYRALFDGLSEGLDDDELMERMGRSAKSLRSTANRLLAAARTLHPETSITGKGLDGFRTFMSEGSEHDWMPLAREVHRTAGQMFWGAVEDEALTLAWEAQTETISAIATRLGTGDAVVMVRLLWLGLAHDRREAVDRLGVAPGSLLDVRQRLADGSAIEQWILTLSDDKGKILHAAIHVDEAAARESLQRKAQRVMSRAGLDVARWTLACRVMGWDSDDTIETALVFRWLDSE